MLGFISPAFDSSRAILAGPVEVASARLDPEPVSPAPFGPVLSLGFLLLVVLLLGFLSLGFFPATETAKPGFALGIGELMIFSSNASSSNASEESFNST